MAKRTTERDRELCLALYRHKILTTGQLELLFFSSRRRAQDRLRSLYLHRVVDRFYPSRPFALGKPVAHWLLGGRRLPRRRAARPGAPAAPLGPPAGLLPPRDP